MKSPTIAQAFDIAGYAKSVYNKLRGSQYKKRYFSILLLIILALLFPLTIKKTNSFLDPCSASISPSSFSQGTTTTATVTVTNNSSVTARYADFVSPTSDYVVTGGSASGWDVEFFDSAEIAFRNGTIAPGESKAFTVNLTIGSTVRSGDIWEVRLDDNADGTDLNNCSGSLSASITEADTTAPSFSSIAVSSISNSQATITWTTNESSTGVVHYGTSNSYGSTQSATSLATSQSVTLSSLSKNTKYYFKIVATDSSSNSGTSTGYDFTTTNSGTTTVTNIITPTPTGAPPAAPTPIPDTTGPTISLTTDLSKPFVTPPLIEGTAADAKGVVDIEYSLDGGKNWLDVEAFRSSTSTSFKFTPPSLEDDNYSLYVRAKDSSGNIGTSGEYTLIIDRLPPQVGSSLISIGPQVLTTTDGLVYGLEGLKQKITLSAVGGPTSIDIIAGKKTFKATKNLDNGLWFADVKFDNPGTYNLEASSVDGAQNKTSRKLSTVVILPSGNIRDGDDYVLDASLTVFVMDPQTRQFVEWDGKSYGQSNPQISENGKYGLFLPPGTYYLEAKSPHHKTLRTEIFTTNESTPVNQEIQLSPKRFIALGPFQFSLPSFSIDVVPINVGVKSEQIVHEIVGKAFPDVELTDGEESFSTSQLSGDPTVISILATWDPGTFEQIGILERASNNVKIIAIFDQENASKISVFKKRGEYSIPFLVDSDGLLVEPLNIQNTPMHAFLDRRGIVKKVMYGVLSEEEILSGLIN